MIDILLKFSWTLPAILWTLCVHILFDLHWNSLPTIFLLFVAYCLAFIDSVSGWLMKNFAVKLYEIIRKGFLIKWTDCKTHKWAFKTETIFFERDKKKIIWVWNKTKWKTYAINNAVWPQGNQFSVSVRQFISLLMKQ